jgi:hypothetical protein
VGKVPERYSRGTLGTRGVVKRYPSLHKQLSPLLELLAIRCINLLTTAGGTVRFNPNLYKDGKVGQSVSIPTVPLTDSESSPVSRTVGLTAVSEAHLLSAKQRAACGGLPYTFSPVRTLLPLRQAGSV